MLSAVKPGIGMQNVTGHAFITHTPPARISQPRGSTIYGANCNEPDIHYHEQRKNELAIMCRRFPQIISSNRNPFSDHSETIFQLIGNHFPITRELAAA